MFNVGDKVIAIRNGTDYGCSVLIKEGLTKFDYAKDDRATIIGVQANGLDLEFENGKKLNGCSVGNFILVKQPAPTPKKAAVKVEKVEKKGIVSAIFGAPDKVYDVKQVGVYDDVFPVKDIEKLCKVMNIKYTANTYRILKAIEKLLFNKGKDNLLEDVLEVYVKDRYRFFDATTFDELGRAVVEGEALGWIDNDYRAFINYTSLGMNCVQEHDYHITEYGSICILED